MTGRVYTNVMLMLIIIVSIIPTAISFVVGLFARPVLSGFLFGFYLVDNLMNRRRIELVEEISEMP